MNKYPGLKEVEETKNAVKARSKVDNEPDVVEVALADGGTAFAPNYDKYPEMDAGELLAWLNID